ncbi:MAG: class II fructose-bisphosphate aldolase [Defluviitaleaceae bacterium]|nr:class II fructose-bisphosphate aldolase [Defluviitaleaceae bacterium]
MPLLKTKAILTHATEHKYGVLAVNTFNFETIKWIVKAAERENVPIIIQFWPGLGTYIPPETVARIAVPLAEKSSVPVAVHLDHSVSYEIAVSGIRAGFPSVMVDGSSLPYEENVALTAEVGRAARVFGVDLEAELGHVGSGANIDDIVNTDHYTNVEQARDFAERTGCDSLAVAVGNAHGAYKQTPNLDFGRIKAIRKILSIPLVLHGCSDIPDEQMKEAVNQGIAKFNVATEYFRAFGKAIAANIDENNSGDASTFLDSLEEPVVDFLRAKIRLVNPNGYAIK